MLQLLFLFTFSVLFIIPCNCMDNTEQHNEQSFFSLLIDERSEQTSTLHPPTPDNINTQQQMSSNFHQIYQTNIVALTNFLQHILHDNLQHKHEIKSLKNEIVSLKQQSVLQQQAINNLEHKFFNLFMLVNYRPIPQQLPKDNKATRSTNTKQS